MKKLLITLILGCSSALLANAIPRDLIDQLDSDEFATRSKAQKELMKWAESAKDDEMKELKEVYDKEESPEAKMRLFDVLDVRTYMARPNTRGFVGITMGPMIGGVRVDRVQPNTPAHKEGLLAGDVIVGVDQHDLTKKMNGITEATDFFSKYVKSKNAGEKLQLKIKRGGRLMDKTLKLGDFDEFNKQFLNQQNQLFLQQGGQQFPQFQVRPNIQLRVVPQNALPQGVPNDELQKMNKELELLLKDAMKNKVDPKQLAEALERHQKRLKAQRDALKKLAEPKAPLKKK